MSDVHHERLKQAYQLLKIGDRTEAARIVQAVIQEDRENLNAWWLIANILEKPDRKLAAAKRVLVLKPDHKGALIMKSELTGEPLPELTSEPQPSEFDFSKLEPIKEKKDGTAGDIQVVRFALIALGIVIIALVSVVGFQYYQNNGLFGFGIEGSPEQAIEQYFTALDNLNFERAADISCERDRAEVLAAQEAFASQMTIPGVDPSDIDFDLSELTYEIINQTNTTATAALSGDLTIRAAGLSMAFDIEALTEQAQQNQGLSSLSANVNLIVENRQWVVCS